MTTQGQPHILGTAPEPFDGNGDKAITFWNVLDNYFTVNATTYNTDPKKVLSALTYFKQGTQAGDWASDRIATALAVNPADYGMWQAFKDSFKAQFIPPEMQIEAIKKVHNTPQKNREFNEWYQEWSKYARRANIDDTTKIYAFCSALNTALHNKILQLSLMPTTLAGLVEKAREFDKNWHTFAGPARGFQHSRNNARIQEISGEDSEINATTQRCTSFGRGRGCSCGRGRLSSEERECHIKHHLCLYCAEPGHHTIECTAPPNCCPGNPRMNNQQGSPSVHQIDTIPEEGMENLTLEDESGVNIASANYFEPLVKINVDDQPSFMDTL